MEMTNEASSRDSTLISTFSPFNGQNSQSNPIQGIGILTQGDSVKVGEDFKSTGFVVFNGKYVLTSAHSLLSFTTKGKLSIDQSEPKYFHMQGKHGRNGGRHKIKNSIICKEWKSYILTKLAEKQKLGLEEEDMHK
jgi:hypothetical protein